MGCPECGGKSRQLVAPGYWECTSSVVKIVPTGAHPSGAFGAPERAASFVCGRRYQDGPAATSELCSCGTLALGYCRACNRAVCHDHSGVKTGQRMCTDCELAHETREAIRIEEHARASANAALDEAIRGVISILNTRVPNGHCRHPYQQGYLRSVRRPVLGSPCPDRHPGCSLVYTSRSVDAYTRWYVVYGIPAFAVQEFQTQTGFDRGDSPVYETTYTYVAEDGTVFIQHEHGFPFNYPGKPLRLQDLLDPAHPERSKWEKSASRMVQLAMGSSRPK